MSQMSKKTCSVRNRKLCKNFRNQTRRALIDGLYLALRIHFDSVRGAQIKKFLTGWVDTHLGRDKFSCRGILSKFKLIACGYLDSLTHQEGGVHPVHSLLVRINANFPLVRRGAPVRANVRGVGLRRKNLLGFAATLNSAKKMLPKVCPCLSADVEKRTLALLGNEDREIPDDYLSWVRHISAQVAYKAKRDGIESYGDYVRRHLPGVGAASDCKRSAGGKRGNYPYHRDEFLKAAFGEDCSIIEQAFDDEGRATVTYSLVQDKGKARGITMTHSALDILMPLHRLIYDAVCKSNWCLRGEATREKFTRFHKKRGEIFVSGDFESATDNLPICVQEAALEVFCKAFEVPVSIVSVAMASLRTSIKGSEGVVRHERGQLMGSPLSFPFLCLQNFFLFSYALREGDRYKEVPVKINGDDIVFRGTQWDADLWRWHVESMGLKLSMAKTSVDANFFSLNSTYFWAEDDHVTPIAFVRLGRFVCKVNWSVEEYRELARTVYGDFYGSFRRVVAEVYWSFVANVLSKQPYRHVKDSSRPRRSGWVLVDEHVVEGAERDLTELEDRDWCWDNLVSRIGTCSDEDRDWSQSCDACRDGRKHGRLKCTNYVERSLLWKLSEGRKRTIELAEKWVFGSSWSSRVQRIRSAVYQAQVGFEPPESDPRRQILVPRYVYEDYISPRLTDDFRDNLLELKWGKPLWKLAACVLRNRFKEGGDVDDPETESLMRKARAENTLHWAERLEQDGFVRSFGEAPIRSFIEAATWCP